MHEQVAHGAEDFFSDTSYEYWGRAASLFTNARRRERRDTGAKMARIYFLPGCSTFPQRFRREGYERFAGVDGTAKATIANPVQWFWRALITDMDQWRERWNATATYRIADGTLVPLSKWAFPPPKSLA